MAGSVGDIVQVSFAGRWQAQVVRNVYYYRVDDTPTGGYLTGLLTEFQSSVHTAFMATQMNQFQASSIQLLNLFSGDILETLSPTPAVGTRTISGDLQPTFMAVSVQLTRANDRVRTGRKSVPIPAEGDNTANTLVGTFATSLAAYAALLDDVLQPGGVDDFTPVIVGRIKYTTPQGKTAYRLPESQAEMGDRWSPIIGARVVARPSTQNTRKEGKGE